MLLRKSIKCHRSKADSSTIQERSKKKTCFLEVDQQVKGRKLMLQKFKEVKGQKLTFRMLRKRPKVKIFVLPKVQQRVTGDKSGVKKKTANGEMPKLVLLRAQTKFAIARLLAKLQPEQRRSNEHFVKA